MEAKELAATRRRQAVGNVVSVRHDVNSIEHFAAARDARCIYMRDVIFRASIASRQ